MLKKRCLLWATGGRRIDYYVADLSASTSSCVLHRFQSRSSAISGTGKSNQVGTVRRAAPSTSRGRQNQRHSPCHRWSSSMPHQMRQHPNRPTLWATRCTCDSCMSNRSIASTTMCGLELLGCLATRAQHISIVQNDCDRRSAADLQRGPTCMGGQVASPTILA